MDGSEQIRGPFFSDTETAHPAAAAAGGGKNGSVITYLPTYLHIYLPHSRPQRVKQNGYV